MSAHLRTDGGWPLPGHLGSPPSSFSSSPGWPSSGEGGRVPVRARGGMHRLRNGTSSLLLRAFAYFSHQIQEVQTAVPPSDGGVLLGHVVSGGR